MRSYFSVRRWVNVVDYLPVSDEDEQNALNALVEIYPHEDQNYLIGSRIIPSAGLFTCMVNATINSMQVFHGEKIDDDLKYSNVLKTHEIVPDSVYLNWIFSVDEDINCIPSDPDFYKSYKNKYKDCIYTEEDKAKNILSYMNSGNDEIRIEVEDIIYDLCNDRKIYDLSFKKI